MDLNLTATLNPPVPAFRAPADATVAVQLSAADLEVLQRGLEAQYSRLADTWDNARQRGADDATRAALVAAMTRVDRLSTALREAARLLR